MLEWRAASPSLLGLTKGELRFRNMKKKKSQKFLAEPVLEIPLLASCSSTEPRNPSTICRSQFIFRILLHLSHPAPPFPSPTPTPLSFLILARIIHFATKYKIDEMTDISNLAGRVENSGHSPVWNTSIPPSLLLLGHNCPPSTPTLIFPDSFFMPLSSAFLKQDMFLKLFLIPPVPS